MAFVHQIDFRFITQPQLSYPYAIFHKLKTK